MAGGGQPMKRKRGGVTVMNSYEDVEGVLITFAVLWALLAPFCMEVFNDSCVRMRLQLATSISDLKLMPLRLTL